MSNVRRKRYCKVLICLCLMWIFIGCSKESVILINETSKENQSVEEDLLKYRMETEHFKYYSYDSDIEILEELSQKLEGKFDLITSRLQYIPQEKIDVEVYPDIKTFHICMGYPNSPNWAVGYAGNGKIQMVSPNNPGPAHNYESLMKAVIHEFTHIIVRGHNQGEIPLWLNEGIASYEAQNIYPIKEVIRDEVKRGQVPTFEELNQKNFPEIKGYQYSTTVVEFLVHTYNYDKLVELIQNPNIKEVYGITEEEMYKQWVIFLQENYQ